MTGLSHCDSLCISLPLCRATLSRDSALCLFLNNVKILTRSPFPTVTFVPEFQSTGVLRAVSSGVMGSCDPLL